MTLHPVASSEALDLVVTGSPTVEGSGSIECFTYSIIQWVFNGTCDFSEVEQCPRIHTNTHGLVHHAKPLRGTVTATKAPSGTYPLGRHS